MEGLRSEQITVLYQPAFNMNNCILAVLNTERISFASFRVLCIHLKVPGTTLPLRDCHKEFLSPVGQFKPGLATTLPLILPSPPHPALSLQITKSGGSDFVQMGVAASEDKCNGDNRASRRGKI